MDQIDLIALLEAQQRELNIQKNIEKAIQEIPESLTQVNMLYIPASINGVDLKLFVDTGAQVSIMPLELSFNLGLEEILDYKTQGIVMGVGKQEIVGKIHYVELQLSDFFVGCSFTVIAEQKDIILGLDMLTAHNMKIDLEKKCLILSNKKINFCLKGDKN